MRFSEDWYSQAGQDQWVTEFFKNKRNGYFLDIGAHDGWGDNNTYYLEKELGWTGICFEPGIQEYTKCKSLRTKAKVVPIAAWSSEATLKFGTYDGSARQVTSDADKIGFPVKAMTLTSIFKKYNVPKIIDYISLDVENSEIEALKGFPFDTHIGIIWTIEHNLYRNDGWLKKGIKEIMLANGYIMYKENVSCKDSNWEPFEDWYVHKNYI